MSAYGRCADRISDLPINYLDEQENVWRGDTACWSLNDTCTSSTDAEYLKAMDGAPYYAVKAMPRKRSQQLENNDFGFIRWCSIENTFTVLVRSSTA